MARNGATVAQGNLALGATLAISDAEVARRADIARQRAELLNLSNRRLEKVVGLGRNQISDALAGIPSRVQHLFDIEQGIRKEAGRMLKASAEIVLEDEPKERIA